MDELIARLERATGPDRNLDKDIARLDAIREQIGDLADDEVPPYTASVDAALSLLPPDDEYEITTLYRIARVTVNMNHGDHGQPFYGESEAGSVPIALCIAALKAASPRKDPTT